MPQDMVKSARERVQRKWSRVRAKGPKVGEREIGIRGVKIKEPNQ